MLVKRPFWQSLLIGAIWGIIITIILSLVEINTDDQNEFSISQFLFYFICFTIFHTFSNRWYIKNKS